MLHRSLSSLEEGDRVQRQGRGPHSGEQKVQEGRQGLEEEEEEEEGRGMQVGLVELQEIASLGVWEEVWGTLQYH